MANVQTRESRPHFRANTGYSGRTAVFEVMELTKNVRRMVLDGMNEDQIKQKAVSEGFMTLRKAGIANPCRRGGTTSA